MNVYEINTMASAVKGNSYVGRGIVLGKTPDGKKAVSAYFIMGRSSNSRNRIFLEEGENVMIKAFDESKLEDPSLIIYYPMRKEGDKLIVTNGDQTDTVWEFIKAGKSFEEALDTRCFEPDGPNWTPRISAMVNADGSFKMSILKSDKGDENQCLRYFYEYASPIEGQARIIHTYNDNGNPIPSFEGEPKTVTGFEGDIDTVTEKLWNSLNETNKVSLFVRFVNRTTGEETTRIVNKNV